MFAISSPDEFLSTYVIMAALCNRGTIIFLPCDFYLSSSSSSFFFSSPNLSGHRLDLYHTSTHGVAPWAPARGGQGGQPPTLEKIRVGHAHPGNINRGLKTFRQ